MVSREVWFCCYVPIRGVGCKVRDVEKVHLYVEHKEEFERMKAEGNYKFKFL